MVRARLVLRSAITAGPDGAMWFTGENWGCYPYCAKSVLGPITTARDLLPSSPCPRSRPIRRRAGQAHEGRGGARLTAEGS
jgi:hypothetical protein